MEKIQKDKYTLMTTKPIEKLIITMAIPSILSMLITSFYNMVDTLFVGRISTNATAGVGIIFSYMAIIQAIAFFFGNGSANFMSRALGAKDKENAEIMASVGFYTAIIIGIFIGIISWVFIDSILIFLGAIPAIFTEARNYLTFILLGTPFIIGTFVLNNQMRLQGNAKLAVIGISFGAILNIILDPIFIFVLNLGVKGASLATCISQFVSLIFLFYLSGKKDGIKIKVKNFKPSVYLYKEIYASGLPSLARQGIGSVSFIFLNRYAGLYGNFSIAAFSIVGRILFFSYSVLLGFGQGFQPICGFNYGAKKYDRVKKAFWFSVKISTLYGIIVGAICFIFAEDIVKLFRAEDLELVAIATKSLRLQAIVMPLLGYVIIANMFLQNIRRTLSASILAISRQGIFFLPTIIIANNFGLTGILLTQPIADVLTFILGIFLGLLALKSLPKETINKELEYEYS